MTSLAWHRAKKPQQGLTPVHDVQPKQTLFVCVGRKRNWGRSHSRCDTNTLHTQVLSAGFFSRSAMRRGLSLVVLKRPRPSSALILLLTIYSNNTTSCNSDASPYCKQITPAKTLNGHTNNTLLPLCPCAVKTLRIQPTPHSLPQEARRHIHCADGVAICSPQPQKARQPYPLPCSPAPS